MKARRADAKEDKVIAADVGDALANSGGDDDNVAWANLFGWKLSDFDAAAAVGDEIAFHGAFHVMPRGGDARLDASTGDRKGLVSGAVIGLDDVTAFGREELSFHSLLPNGTLGIHGRSFKKSIGILEGGLARVSRA